MKLQEDTHHFIVVMVTVMCLSVVVTVAIMNTPKPLGSVTYKTVGVTEEAHKKVADYATANDMSYRDTASFMIMDWPKLPKNMIVRVIKKVRSNPDEYELVREIGSSDFRLQLIPTDYEGDTYLEAGCKVELEACQALPLISL